MRIISRLALLNGVSALLLGGCAAGPLPRNAPAAGWMPQQQLVSDAQDGCMRSSASGFPSSFDAARRTDRSLLESSAAILSPGDRLRVQVAGDENDMTGVHVIGDDGRLTMPGVAPIEIAGVDIAEAGHRIEAGLVKAELLRAPGHFVHATLIETAGVSVSVQGAVFAAGTVRAGERQAEDRVGQKEGIADGDANAGRTLSAALRAAGGIRPDADLSDVRLMRQGRWISLDLRGALDGTGLADMPVAGGDSIFVSSSGCFDQALVRPSPLTPPGIRVYMSNLSRPAANNAGAAIGRDATSLPYGTRLLQALVAANCVGGSAMNAGRRAILISRNPLTGQSVVIQRDVESLVRSASRDEADPYLMPGDALACYDSRWMNFSDILSLVSGTASAVTPALLLRKGGN